MSGAFYVTSWKHAGRNKVKGAVPVAPNVLMGVPVIHVVSVDNAMKPPLRPLFWAGLAPARPWPATASPTFFP
jgi:hypothetical protein